MAAKSRWRSTSTGLQAETASSRVSGSSSSSSSRWTAPARGPAAPRASSSRRCRGPRSGGRRPTAFVGRPLEPGAEGAVEDLEVVAAAPRACRTAPRRPRRGGAGRRGRGPAARSAGGPGRPRPPPRAGCDRRSRASGRRRPPAWTASPQRRPWTRSSSAARSASRTRSRSSWYFSTEPSVASTVPRPRSSSWPSASSACVQSMVSATPGAFARSSARSSCTNARGLRRQPLGHAGHAAAHDLDLALQARDARTHT